MEGENVFEGGLIYDGELGGVGVEASVVGLYGKLKNGGEDDSAAPIGGAFSLASPSICLVSSSPATSRRRRSATRSRSFSPRAWRMAMAR
jgi:hypothetical protein